MMKGCGTSLLRRPCPDPAAPRADPEIDKAGSTTATVAKPHHRIRHWSTMPAGAITAPAIAIDIPSGDHRGLTPRAIATSTPACLALRPMRSR